MATATSIDASILAGLDETQRDAVTTPHVPLAILAGAGSGKTRVLTRRIAWQAVAGNVDPAHVLAVTFTRKAADELRGRLNRLGVGDVAAGTIHAIALAQLRRRAAERGRDLPALLERKARILVTLVGGRGADALLAASEIATEIEWAKARLVAPDGYERAVAEARRATPRPAAEVAELYARYEREKRRRRLFDFDDLVWSCADALHNDTEFAAAQRWRFRHFFVDEFQDTSAAQLLLLRGWVADRCDLCVVGDPDQAIYGFAGAEAGLLTAFPRHFPGAQVVRLGHNYRSTPQVVAAARALLADGGGTAFPLRAHGGDGPDPSVTEYADDTAEAAAVASRLRDLHDLGTRWDHMAVLYRTNAQSAAFEEALRGAAIPFRVRGTERFLERPEVQAALAELRRSAARAPGRTLLEHLTDLAEATDAERDDERQEHINALVRLGHEYLAADGTGGSVEGLHAFLKTTLRGGDLDTSHDAVDLLTFHRAKGLEFDVVFIVGLERGLVPIARAETPEARAEERRLLYVALTRARREVQLSYARERTIGVRTVKRSRSPWLAPIEAANRPALPDRAAKSATAGLGEARDRLRATSRPESGGAAHPQLLAALVESRRSLARASGVPAYGIFSDRTLHAIAAERPRSRRALFDISGIGPVKLERHGAAVLDLVTRHGLTPTASQ